MILNTIAEVCWKFYGDGKQNATNQKLSQADIMQMCRMSAANNFRQQYLFGQKVIPGKKILALPEEPEIYFVSPLLSINRFPLSDATVDGIRIADMKDFDLYRLPKNAHFTNLYLVNEKCGGQKIGNITPIKNGEERYYSKPKFKGSQFYTVVGRTVKTLNVPPCVPAIDIETTYDNDNIDISLDIAYDVCQEVLGLIFKIEDAEGEFQLKLQEEIKKREDIK